METKKDKNIKKEYSGPTFQADYYPSAVATLPLLKCICWQHVWSADKRN